MTMMTWLSRGLPLAGLLIGLLGSVSAQTTPTPAPRFGDPVDSIGGARQLPPGLDGLPGAGVSNLPIDPTGEAARAQRRADFEARITAQAADYQRQATGMLTSAQSYLAAVTASTQQSASYLGDTPAYLAGCAEAPWSCAAYAYDAVTGAYFDNSALSSTPLNSAPIDRAALDGAQLPPISDPTPSAEAYQAISLFTWERLGTPITPLYAGTLTEDITRVIAYLPDEISALIASVSSYADTAYWGLWAGGTGAVMFADCADPTACAVSGASAFPTTNGDNEAGFAMVFSVEIMPTDAAGALATIMQVYPALRGLAFTELTDISAGFAFNAITGPAAYPESPGITTMGVVTGVVNVAGRTVVYAVLAGTTLQAEMPDSPFS